MADQPAEPPIVPYLMVHDGPAALAWYERALGGCTAARYDMDDGRLGHAMIEINGGAIYLADEFPELGDRVGTRAPQTLGGTSVNIALAVDDTDFWMDRAVAEGAEVLRPAEDDFYGRHGKVRDPYGHVWSMVGPKRMGGC
jgi:PhnB protein